MRASGFDLGQVTAEAVFTAGAWTKFGVDLEDIPHFLKTLGSHPHVRFLGFHTISAPRLPTWPLTREERYCFFYGVTVSY